MTIHFLTNLVKAQPRSPTRYSPKPQDYNLLFPLLDDRPLEPLQIHYRIESLPSFDSFSIPVKSSSHIQNHIELNQSLLRKALKPILDSIRVTWIGVQRCSSNRTLCVGAWGIQIRSDGLIRLHDGIACMQGSPASRS